MNMRPEVMKSVIERIKGRALKLAGESAGAPERQFIPQFFPFIPGFSVFVSIIWGDSHCPQ